MSAWPGLHRARNHRPDFTAQYLAHIHSPLAASISRSFWGWFWVLVWEVPCFALPYWCWVGEPGTRGGWWPWKAEQTTFIISGFFWHKDEAVLAAILQQLRSLAPGSRCIVISGIRQEPLRNTVLKLSTALTLRAWSALRQGTVFISGGGTLFRM